jgi:hypothetical protein
VRGVLYQMEINKENAMAVSFWLLQCDPSDFEGPLEPIAEWFEALGDAYLTYESNSSSSNALTCAEKVQAVLLARLLFQHLNQEAQIHVRKMLKRNQQKPLGFIYTTDKKTEGNFLSQWLQKIKRKAFLPFIKPTDR